MNAWSSFLLTAVVTALPAVLSAQSIWTNAASDFSFSNSANWTTGVPAPGANLSLATSDFVGLDNGGDFLASSLVIQSGVNGAFLSAGPETLSIGVGGIFNQGLGVDFQAPLLAVATQTWHVGSGTFSLGNAFTILNGATVTIAVDAGAAFDFAMFALNPDWDGTLNFIGDLDSSSFTVTGDGFSMQNLAQITFDGRAASLNDGILTGASAVPEPSTYGFVGAALLLSLAARRSGCPLNTRKDTSYSPRNTRTTRKNLS